MAKSKRAKKAAPKKSARAKRITLSPAYVHTIRAAAKRKGGAGAAPAKRGLGRRSGVAPKTGGGNEEQALVRAIISVGTARARQVLEHVEREVSRIQAPR